MNGSLFCVMGGDLITAMSKHYLLDERSVGYLRLAFWEGGVPVTGGVFILRDAYVEFKIRRETEQTSRL